MGKHVPKTKRMTVSVVCGVCKGHNSKRSKVTPIDFAGRRSVTREPCDGCKGKGFTREERDVPLTAVCCDGVVVKEGDIVFGPSRTPMTRDRKKLKGSRVMRDVYGQLQANGGGGKTLWRGAGAFPLSEVWFGNALNLAKYHLRCSERSLAEERKTFARVKKLCEKGAEVVSRETW